MEQFKLELKKQGQSFSFDVVDYLHHEHSHCKFELFNEGKLLASFEPDLYGYLHICKNPANLNEELLHEIAEKLESYHTSFPGETDPGG